jgi:hypothetical protein
MFAMNVCNAVNCTSRGPKNASIIFLLICKYERGRIFSGNGLTGREHLRNKYWLGSR